VASNTRVRAAKALMHRTAHTHSTDGLVEQHPLLHWEVPSSRLGRKSIQKCTSSRALFCALTARCRRETPPVRSNGSEGVPKSSSRAYCIRVCLLTTRCRRETPPVRSNGSEGAPKSSSRAYCIRVCLLTARCRRETPPVRSNGSEGAPKSSSRAYCIRACSLTAKCRGEMPPGPSRSALQL